jgi:hypothetical protein
MTRKTIAIDGTNFRLAFDADNVMIEELISVDPTKAPAFDASKHDATIRQEWRNIGKYFATIPKALTYLLEYKLRTGDATTLAEVRYDIAEFRRHIDGLLDTEVTRR